MATPDRFRENNTERGISDRRQEALDDRRGAESWAHHPGRISYEEMVRRIRLNLTADGEEAR